MKVQKFVINYFRTKIRLLAGFSKRCAGNQAFTLFCTPYYRLLYKPRVLRNAEPLRYIFEGRTTFGYRWNKGGRIKLLIAHGFRSSSANFEHFAQKLAVKGYEVIAFDAPAHGRSEGKRLNAITYKNFIAALNVKFGPFDAYLTHSFGGLAVSMNLAEMPVNHNIKTVLIAPAANSKTLIELFFKEMRIKDKKVQQYFYANIERLSGQTIEWFSLKRCADAIRGEVLWVHDWGDRITPVDDAQELERLKRDNFHFLFTQNLGHRRIYRDEKVVASVVAFL